jgi:exodeoxyribonuclease VII small subunit
VSGGEFKELRYEQIVERLEATIARMADGTVGIEEAAALYEEAGKLHAAATDRLDALRARIESLTEGAASDG